MTRTPDEIKTAMECCQDYQSCTKYDETQCPYYDVKGCVDTLLADVLALIQQLEATVSEKEKVVAELSGKIGQLESQNRCFKENKESCEKRMVDLAQRMPRWISVEERLPEPGEDCALYVRCGDVSFVRTGWRMKNGQFICPSDSLHGYEVTHWMPLPSAPKEE